MRKPFAIAFASLLLTPACERPPPNEVNQVAESHETEQTAAPKTEDEVEQEEQEERLSEAERISKKNAEILARLAEEERARQLEKPEAATNMDPRSTESLRSDVMQDRKSPEVDLSSYEDRLNKLAARYEEAGKELRKAADECKPKRVETTGYARDPVTGEMVSIDSSGWVEGSQAACVEAEELRGEISNILTRYDEVYHDYTLEAMKAGILRQCIRRQLPIPKRR